MDVFFSQATSLEDADGGGIGFRRRHVRIGQMRGEGWKGGVRVISESFVFV